ncbi:fungal-specific transcription factor domain-containing protein [Lentinula boryana]|uniref:Fungal-specific transcription factor domain-containing protein n=1 Tax=Lentinula boryana TaxID=40481 RepID=A0ABQ8QSS0_9AGAR|nr:fungal-specific transcription factor domain-containing protein [Lentinula boryana]
MSSDETVMHAINAEKEFVGSSAEHEHLSHDGFLLENIAPTMNPRKNEGLRARMRCFFCVSDYITHFYPSYVDRLEKRVKTMEEMLRKYHVQVDDVRDRQQPSAHPNQTQSSTSSTAVDSSSNYNGVPSSISSNPGYPSLAESSSPESIKEEEEEEDFAHVALADHLSKLSLNTVQRRFFGPSSAFMIMKNAHRVKEEALGYDIHPFKRPQYWGMQAWERDSSERESPVYTFPEADLIFALVTLYFSEVNVFLPILHAPSFKQCIEQKLHLHDHNFGTTLLLVCAVASRYSNDSRVFTDSSSQLSCGWHYFEQARMSESLGHHLLMVHNTVYELQFYCLATIYMLGTSSPSSSWILCAAGIRFAEELGVHRRQPEGQKWTSLDEQKRRAFWVLVSLDRLISGFVGRPSAIRDEDFDCDLPIECDDEYWENPQYPELSFKHPPNKPSIISCFNSHLRLCEILAFALRTLYSTKKSKLLLGLVGEEWEQKILREIDSALQKWFKTVPEHLQWKPMQQNAVFFRQSVFLYTMYYNVQIQAHRPFLHKPSQASFHSLAQCTNAARSTIQVLNAHMSRGIIGLPQVLYSAFISAMVIMFNLWGSKRAGIKINQESHERDIQNAKVILNMLHNCDQRWNIAGRFWDMLSELLKDFNIIDRYRRNVNEPLRRSEQRTQESLLQSQATASYQTLLPQSYPPHTTQQLDSQVSADSQLASQLLYGWRLTGESPPAWTNQQTAESLSHIDKKTLAYLEQIFGRIDNFQNDPEVVYEDAGQGVYQDRSQGYYPTDLSQLQPGYARSGVNDNATGFWPDGVETCNEAVISYISCFLLNRSRPSVIVRQCQEIVAQTVRKLERSVRMHYQPKYVQELEEKIRIMTEKLQSKDLLTGYRLTNEQDQDQQEKSPVSPSSSTSASISSNLLSAGLPSISSLNDTTILLGDNAIDSGPPLDLSSDFVQDRFFGASSGYTLMKKAYDVKTEVLSDHEIPPRALFQRPEYWFMRPWERASRNQQMPRYNFPETDLMLSLVSLYLINVNIFFPIVHAPTFKRLIVEGLHLRDQHFGAVVLLVCAVGSKYTADPRVLHTPDFELSSIVDTNVALGIRFCCELGLHRRKPDGHIWTLEEEQKKRAFCVDADLPLQRDDEEWADQNPNSAYEQSSDKPSIIAAFNSYLRLCDILDFALRTLYSTKKSQLLLGLVGQDWREKTVYDLDSSLNEWISSLPEYSYYHLQVQLTPYPYFSNLMLNGHNLRSIYIDHFFQNLRLEPFLRFQFVRLRQNLVPVCLIASGMYAAFAAGVVLLFDLWANKRAGIKIEDQHREMQSVEILLRVLQEQEVKSASAGRFWYIQPSNAG